MTSAIRVVMLVCVKMRVGYGNAIDNMIMSIELPACEMSCKNHHAKPRKNFSDSNRTKHAAKIILFCNSKKFNVKNLEISFSRSNFAKKIFSYD